MKCLNIDEMQLYIDDEVSLELQHEIHNHIIHCEICLGLFNEANTEKQALLKVLSYCDENFTEKPIPAFKIPERKTKIYVFQVLKFAASIAIIIGLFLVFHKKESPQNKVEDLTLSSVKSLDNSDPNKKWHNNQVEVIITDEKGNIIESFISEK